MIENANMKRRIFRLFLEIFNISIFLFSFIIILKFFSSYQGEDIINNDEKLKFNVSNCKIII